MGGGRQRGRTCGRTSDTSCLCSPGIQSELHLLQHTPWCSSRWIPSRRSWNRWHSPQWAGKPAAGSGPAAHWLNRTHSIGGQPQVMSRGQTFHTLPNLPKLWQKLNSAQSPFLGPLHVIDSPLFFLYMEATGSFLQEVILDDSSQATNTNPTPVFCFVLFKITRIVLLVGSLFVCLASSFLSKPHEAELGLYALVSISQELGAAFLYLVLLTFQSLYTQIISLDPYNSNPFLLRIRKWNHNDIK